MLNKIFIVFLGTIMLSVTLTSFTTEGKAQEKDQAKEDEEYSYLENDDYAQTYDENYFKDNALKINEINNMVEENNRQLAKQESS